MSHSTIQLATACVIAACLTGCGSGASLTVHNAGDQAVMVSGIGSGLRVEAGTRERVALRRAVDLVARADDGAEVDRASVPAPPRGGEAVWAVGGGACFAEADFGSYYGGLEESAGAVVIGSLTAEDRLYVSSGRVHAGPDQMLPRRARGAVRALVEVPCAATAHGEAILQAWLEIKLLEIQPSER